jgi:predicted permease
MLENLAQDLRYALRAMRRSPGLTAVAALSLALGIGANTAIFSLMDAVLLRTLPVDKPEELERIGVMDGSSPGFTFSYPMFRELRQRNQTFSGVFARAATPVSLVATGRTERGVVELVSGNYFSVLGVRPLLGRVLADADDRTPLAHPVAVLSYRYWNRRLAADPGIVGKTVRIDNYPFMVIGVAPPAFYGIEVGSAPDAWIPMLMQPQIFGRGRPSFNEVGWGWLSIFGRRSPGIGESKARAGLDVAFQQIRSEGGVARFWRRSNDARIYLEPGSKGLSRLRGQFENPLYVLMAAVALVLLIACANIANLLLARSVARRKEIAVRLALGAGRARLVRQLLTESTLLGLLGGSLGCFLAAWTVPLLLRFLPADRLPFALEVHLDARLLGFAFFISAATGVVFGLAPALQATRPDVAPSLKDEGSDHAPGSRGFELKNALVVAQVALSLLLLVGAGLFLRSLRNAAAIDAGLNTESVLLASVNPELSGYSPPEIANFYHQLEERLRELPGVRAVGASEAALLSGESSSVGLTVPGRPLPPSGPARGILMNRIGGDFFPATGGAVLHGRNFGPQDTAASPKVAILNQTAARYFFGGEEAVGRKVRLSGEENVEIIGVARDSKYRSVREETPRIAYESFEQDRRPSAERTIYIRTTGDPLSVAPALRREVQALDKDLPVFNVKTFAQQKNESLVRERLIATLCGFFGALALALASIGLYGVMAYSVQRRTREIGIRMSLGAARGTVLRMVLRDCLRMVMAGVALGFLLSLWCGRLVSSQLYGVSPADSVTLAIAGLILTTAAALAGYLPALRASRVDPLVALRHE